MRGWSTEDISYLTLFSCGNLPHKCGTGHGSNHVTSPDSHQEQKESDGMKERCKVRGAPAGTDCPELWRSVSVCCAANRLTITDLYKVHICYMVSGCSSQSVRATTVSVGLDLAYPCSAGCWGLTNITIWVKKNMAT